MMNDEKRAVYSTKVKADRCRRVFFGHVLYEAPAAQVGLLANLALVLLTSNVREPMLLKVTSAAELPGAQVAAERTGVGVRGHVFLEAAAVREALGAHRAGKWLNATMAPLVGDKTLLGSHFLTADVALEQRRRPVLLVRAAEICQGSMKRKKGNVSAVRVGNDRRYRRHDLHIVPS